MGWAGQTNNVIKALIDHQINVKAAATNSVGQREEARYLENALVSYWSLEVSWVAMTTRLYG